MASSYPAQIRIIAGRWRRRYIPVPNQPQLRPTPNRIRETLFNWLAPVIRNSRCLDLFAGSGALSFEAVSRGADFAQIVDNNADCCRHLNKQVQRFQASDQIQVACMSAERYLLQAASSPYHVIFLDAPFNQDLINPTLRQLEQSSCVQPGVTFIYAEQQKHAVLALPESWHVLRQSQAASVTSCLIATAVGQNL